MTNPAPHPLLDQLAQLQLDVTTLRDWAALLDDALHDFASALNEILAAEAEAPHERTHEAHTWPTERSALALRARRVREEAGLTRIQLARLTHVADSTIRNLERGRHKASNRTLQRLLPQLQQLERTLRALHAAPSPLDGDHSHGSLTDRS